MRRIVLLAVLVTLVAGACGGGMNGVETVNRLVDEWAAAWLAGDPDAVAALFTEDGVYGGADGGLHSGREEIAAYVQEVSMFITEPSERTGDAVENADDTFTVPVRVTTTGVTNERSISVTLGGDLIARLAFIFG